jgi:N-dimethylarginine dimethylaminohydrolase
VINVGQNILTSPVGARLASRLTDLGYVITELELTEFVRGGGSAKALALRLSDSKITNAI